MNDNQPKDVGEQFSDAAWPLICLARALRKIEGQEVTIMVTADGATMLHKGMYCEYVADIDSEKH